MPFLNRSAGRTTLLVDPDPSLLETRRLLLLSASYSVQTACAARDVYQFQPEDEPEIAVLSDALGSSQLLAVAEYVRHRWPRARIVIIGKAVPALED
jgi:ActR/RegA family two-component response regulator